MWKILLLLLALPAAGGPVDGRDEIDDCSEDDNDEIDFIEIEEVDEEVDVTEHTIELMEGKTKDVIWCILDNNFIHLVNTKSVDERTFWWECRFRKLSKCQFRMETKVREEDENKDDELAKKHEIVWMMNPETHSCGQEEVDILVAKFRSKVKHQMTEKFKAKYMHVYETTKKDLLKSIKNEDLREQLRHALPAAATMKTSVYDARKRGIPVAPKSLKDVDLSLITGTPTDFYLVGEDRESEVWLFGTKNLAKEFCYSTFKSSDGTFKISPRLSYQGCIDIAGNTLISIISVLLFLCWVGGVYITSFIAVMPGKTKSLYDKVSLPSKTLYNLLHNLCPCPACQLPKSLPCFLSGSEAATRCLRCLGL